MRKILLVIGLLAFSLQISAVGFEKNYKSAPLYEVLQDLESHFGLSFLYRPSDIADSQPVTITIKTNDANKALKQALGSSLQFTTRNGIIIITKAPEKKTSFTRVQSMVEAETPTIVMPDTLPEEEPSGVWQAIPYLRPGEQLYISPIDTIRISKIAQRAINSLPTASNQSTTKKSNNVNGLTATRFLFPSQLGC